MDLPCPAPVRHLFSWRLRLLAVSVAGALIESCYARGACDYGALPGTMEEDGEGWKTFDKNCPLENLLPYYLGLSTASSTPTGSESGHGHHSDASIMLLGDSVDRWTVWDVNDTARSGGSHKLETLLNEHWRVALRLPHLELVYQFAPGSHVIGPYHDDVPWNMTIANALPRAFELHKLLTGRAHPNIIIFSDMLWDLGRWLFLSEIAEPERTEHYGKPLLRNQEFLPPELLEEWRDDTELQMLRIEERARHDALLIYHNSAFALLRDCKNGTDHFQNGMGKRTHLVQLNALARQILSPNKVQIVAENPRWHLVDLGQMSEAYLSGSHLRDPHHPKPDFMLQVLNIYLNLHKTFGHRPRPVEFAKGDVGRWDSDYSKNAEKMQNVYLTELNQSRSRRQAGAPFQPHE